ncbi:MAG TPA: integrase core domain-containing protein [Jiangellaceae bacterium]|nr:integrase core domain-containing protein [Jiangellaceae bacterium]
MRPARSAVILAAQPDQPTSIAELQTMLDRSVAAYNQQRPHRSLPQRATPAAIKGSTRTHPPLKPTDGLP